MSEHTTSSPPPNGRYGLAGGIVTAALAAILVLGELLSLDAAIVWSMAGLLNIPEHIALWAAVAGALGALWATAAFTRSAIRAERALADGRYRVSAEMAGRPHGDGALPG